MSGLSRRSLLRVAALGAAATLSALGIAARTDGQSAWDDLVAAARAEGRLSIVTWGTTWGGSGFRTVFDAFERTFPGVLVDPWLAESSPSVWLGKVRGARRARAEGFDLAIVQPDAAIKEGRPDGMWAPIRPLLLHPEVLDEAAWRDGLSARFLDAAGDLCFAWEYQALHVCAVNADLVADGEIGNARDLFDPKWTARIVSLDPRIGLGLHMAAAMARSWGPDALERVFVDQRPTLTTSARELSDGLISGRHAISLGLRPKALQPYRADGSAGRVRFLDLPDADVAATTPLLYFDRSPHPAAAKLFANWVLTRTGQALLAGSLPTNSARTDVESFESSGIATPGMSYYEPDRESSYPHTAETSRRVRALLTAAGR